MIKLIIFDLDDVLFPEIQYIGSGFRVVANTIASNVNDQERLFQRMIELFEKDRKNVFDRLVQEFENLEQSEKETIVNRMIEIYRTHRPKIELYDDVLPILQKLGCYTAILSDGRTTSQQLKIEVLNLTDKVDRILLTDMLGDNRVYWKPNSHAFEKLLEDFNVVPSEACYVGDNVTKDFDGPNKIGMHSILIMRPNGLYFDELNHSKSDLIPVFQIKSLNDLLKTIQEIDNLHIKNDESTSQ